MAPDNTTVTVTLEGIAVADAGAKIKSLRQDILDAARDVRAELVKADNSTQDFGTTLVLVLGTPVAIAVAKGIADWLRREGGKATLVISADGAVTFKGNSADAPAIAKALAPKQS